MFLQKRQSFYQFLIIYQRTSLNLFCECYSLPVVRTFITSQTGILMWISKFTGRSALRVILHFFHSTDLLLTLLPVPWSQSRTSLRPHSPMRWRSARPQSLWLRLPREAYQNLAKDVHRQRLGFAPGVRPGQVGIRRSVRDLRFDFSGGHHGLLQSGAGFLNKISPGTQPCI